MARSVPQSVIKLGLDSSQLFALVEVIEIPSNRVLLSTRPQPDSDIPQIEIVRGEVSIDETKNIQGTANLELLINQYTDTIILPTGPESPLSPVAPTMVSVGFGVIHEPNAEPEIVRVGLFEIADIDVAEEGSGLRVTLELYDMARRLERARFFRPLTIPKGTLHTAAIIQLIADVLPFSDINLTPYSTRTGVLSFGIQDDRLSAIRELCSSIGYLMTFDGEGNVRIHPDTDSEADPAWIVTDEHEFGANNNVHAVSVGRLLSDEKAYNGVIAMGEASGSTTPPVRAEYWDTDPESPTYFDPAKPEESKYGPVPFFYISQFITTKKQAADAARARLPKVLGLGERIRLQTLPNPGIEPGDVILLNRARVAALGTFIVESVTYPLTASQGSNMTVICRERKLRI